MSDGFSDWLECNIEHYGYCFGAYDNFPKQLIFNAYWEICNHFHHWNVYALISFAHVQEESIHIYIAAYVYMYIPIKTGPAHYYRTLFLATGMSVPNVPVYKGIEHVMGYESIPTDPEFYEGKSVLILGKLLLIYTAHTHIFQSTSLMPGKS